MITKEANDNTHFVLPKFFFGSARKCFSIILKSLFYQDEKILMPSYIGQSPKEGSGVFDPVRQTKTNYEFYRVGFDLQADVDDIEKKIRNNNVRALLLIHYFGFPQKHILRIKELCVEENVILIEDCAHTLNSSLGNYRLGSIGDLSFYSLHKLLPCNSGGCLQVNNLTFLQSFIGYNEDIDCYDLLTLSKADVESTSQVRVVNYKYYLSLLRKDSHFFDILYPNIEEGVVPLNFPIVIKNYDRFKFYNELIDKGIITVSLYYQMIEELDCKQYADSYKLSKTILNLPVHQDTTLEDIETICTVLNEWS